MFWGYKSNNLRDPFFFSFQIGGNFFFFLFTNRLQAPLLKEGVLGTGTVNINTCALSHFIFGFRSWVFVKTNTLCKEGANRHVG